MPAAEFFSLERFVGYASNSWNQEHVLGYDQNREHAIYLMEQPLNFADAGKACAELGLIITGYPEGGVPVSPEAGLIHL